MVFASSILMIKVLFKVASQMKVNLQKCQGRSTSCIGAVIPTLIGNPYTRYLNPYYKVDDHPYHTKTMWVYAPAQIRTVLFQAKNDSGHFLLMSSIYQRASNSLKCPGEIILFSEPFFSMSRGIHMSPHPHASRMIFWKKMRTNLFSEIHGVNILISMP